MKLHDNKYRFLEMSFVIRAEKWKINTHPITRPSY
jgi:hypothetical protein